MLFSTLASAVSRANQRAAAAMAGWRTSLTEAVRTATTAPGTDGDLARALSTANGVELWRGPSQLTGDPIVVILTGTRRGTDNIKTGDMLQVWYLPQEEAPNRAVKSGLDQAVCGDCKHRPINGGACYVATHQAPRAIWQAWKNGSYPRMSAAQTSDLLQGAAVRLGAWGDPAAAHPGLARLLATQAEKRTGYTHQWARADAQPLKAHLMASVDTPEEAAQAHALGWRTFRVTDGSAADAYPAVMAAAGISEVVCLSDTEKRTCAACTLCDGGSRGKSVRITVHGSTPRVRAYRAQRTT